MRLEDRFDKEMNEAKGSIVSLERQNEKLTGEFSAAKERIVSLEGEVQRLSGLLLRQSAQPNRRHADAAAAAVGSANDNSQSMTGQIESEGYDESSITLCIVSLYQYLTCLMLNAIPYPSSFSHRIRLSHE